MFIFQMIESATKEHRSTNFCRCENCGRSNVIRQPLGKVYCISCQDTHPCIWDNCFISKVLPSRSIEAYLVPNFDRALLSPLLNYRGNLKIGDISRRWNMTVTAHFLGLSFFEIRMIWIDRDFCKRYDLDAMRPLCSVSLAGWFSRLMANKELTSMVPGLGEYCDVDGRHKISLPKVC